MSRQARLWRVCQGGSFWRSLCCLAVVVSCLGPTVLSCSDCLETLTGLSGQFSSPCYPKTYDPNLKCKWTILAPTGFIIQLTFQDFDLEEAQGCPYDFVEIKTGAEKLKFCGVTAKGHTLNSTKNEMIVEFKTDFSIQKRGFMATYRRVAVSLHNQKVVMENPSQQKDISVSPSVSFPDMEQFTVCMEVKTSSIMNKWVPFSYLGPDNRVLINFSSMLSSIVLAISGVECQVSTSLDSSDETFVNSWQQLCISWDGASGGIITQTGNRYRVNDCPDSRGKSIAGEGSLSLTPKQGRTTFSGQVYNFRLWNSTMPGPSLLTLPCEEMGNVVDWVNSDWNIPASMLEADSELSCASKLPATPTIGPTCSSFRSACQATTSPAYSNTPTTNIHTTNSVDPSPDGTNTPRTEVTTHGSPESTEPTGSFNKLDLQRFQVLPNECCQGSNWQMEQRSRRIRNPLGIISTPLRFPLRPRPRPLKPVFPHVHDASIVFTKTVTKSSLVNKESNASKKAASNVTVMKHLPPSIFPNFSGGNITTNQSANIPGLTSEFLTRLPQVGRQFRDLKFVSKNSTTNVTENTVEITVPAPETHEAITRLGTDARMEILSLKTTNTSVLSSSSGQRSSDELNLSDIQTQGPFPARYHPINPTPTRSLPEVSADSIASPGHLLYGSFWTPTSNMMRLINPLNPLGDLLIKETSTQSLHGNAESSIDSHGSRFSTEPSSTKSPSTASPEENSLLTGWPSSLLDPGQFASIIFSPPLERHQNGVSDTPLIQLADLLHLAMKGQEPMGSTQRLLINTEQIANQLRKSQEFTQLSGQFLERSRMYGTPSSVKHVDKDLSPTSGGLHKKTNHASTLMFVSTPSTMLDMVYHSPIPGHFLDISPSLANSEFRVDLTQLQSNSGKLSLGSAEYSVHFSNSLIVRSFDVSTTMLQLDLRTSDQQSQGSVATRALELQLENASPFKDSQWSLSMIEARCSLLPLSKLFVDKDCSEVSLTPVTLHNTRGILTEPTVTENTWEMMMDKNTGWLTKNAWVSLHTSSILPSDVEIKSLTSVSPDPENESLMLNIPALGNKVFTSNIRYPENKSLTSNIPHLKNESLTSNTPNSGNIYLTSKILYQGNDSITSDTPHPGNEILAFDMYSLGKESLTSDIANPGNESFISDTPHSEKNLLTFDTFHRKNDSNGLPTRNNSSTVVGSLKPSLLASVADVWSSWTAPLDQRSEAAVLFQSLDVSKNIRRGHTSLLHPDHLSKSDDIPILRMNSSHGTINVTDFPGFSLTDPGPFQENWSVFQANHLNMTAGSSSQENFMISATQMEMEAQKELQMTWLALSLDGTVEEVSRSPALPESSEGPQVMTLLPVHLGAQVPSLNTPIPLLFKEHKHVQYSDIFTVSESELTLVSRSTDSQTLSTASTNQQHIRTLKDHTSKIYAREPPTYSMELQSLPRGEQVSEMVFATPFQQNVGSPEPILLPTLLMSFPALPSMSELAWELKMSIVTNKWLLKGSQTSSTHSPNLQFSCSPTVLPSPPALPHDVPGFSRTFDSGLGSAEPSVPSKEASSLLFLCEGMAGRSCLCGILIANRGVFYRMQFTLYSQSSGNPDIHNLKEHVSMWLNKSFQNWNYTVQVISVSIFESNATSSARIVARSIKDKGYLCKAILYYNITKNIYLEERVVQERLWNTSSTIGNNLTIYSINVQPIVNCSSEENPSQYKWTETRPQGIQYLPCLSNRGLFVSRKCTLNTQNYTSYWEPPDLSNCSISPISNVSDLPDVTADNAAEVANQLLDLSADKDLTREEVDQLVEKLNQIVIVSQINSSLASTVLIVLSNILSSSDNALTTSSQVALRTVDALTAKMIFSGSSVSITTRNLAIGISAIDSQAYNGTSFGVGSADGEESQLKVALDGEPLSDPLAEIELPLSIFEQLTVEEISEVSRAQFAFFSRTGLFQDPREFSLQSFVVASSVGNITIRNLSESVRIRIKHRSPKENFKPLCAFWDLTLNNESGGWSTQGCEADSGSNANETICLCNHLTHFGILLDISGTAQQIDPLNTKILTFITHIGCGISAIFSATTLLTYVAFEKLRRDYPSKILMNLSASLFFLNFTFLIDGWLASFEIEGLCVAVAALLHFFLLASFTWMGLEAIHMYIALVKVFNTYIRKYMLKFCIVGWGLPALVVVIVLAISRNFYGLLLYGRDDKGAGASEFCWISNPTVFYVTCVCYFSILFLMNISMFIVVLIQICGRNGKKSNRNLREEILRNLRSVTSLTFLLGMTWGFAFFAWGPVNLSFMYLFAIFNSLQGFFVFFFHCALKENVQKQWRRYLCCGRFRLPENSEWSRTITNNTKKVSSDNLGKSLSSSSIGSSSTSWASKFKSSSSFFKGGGKGGLLAAVTSSKFGHLDACQEPVVPVHNVLDKVTSFYPTHSDNFYKNIMMSDNFSHSTKF